ncbi:MAG: hypothetical protein DI536_31300 [Archangium gephyra]|uniref:Uncharacterized protein n=1 Tax=Archangium gephyra TaxID=48 RepID=A0A2W5SRS2_9BACT|nr:MAG: hypothetical protein DI536_31300 [Archangium gephyra]
MLKDERPRGPGTVRPFVFLSNGGPGGKRAFHACRADSFGLGFAKPPARRSTHVRFEQDVEPSMGAVRELSLAVPVARWLRGLEAKAGYLS